MHTVTKYIYMAILIFSNAEALVFMTVCDAAKFVH